MVLLSKVLLNHSKNSNAFYALFKKNKHQQKLNIGAIYYFIHVSLCSHSAKNLKSKEYIPM